MPPEASAKAVPAQNRPFRLENARFRGPAASKGFTGVSTFAYIGNRLLAPRAGIARDPKLVVHASAFSGPQTNTLKRALQTKTSPLHEWNAQTEILNYNPCLEIRAISGYSLPPAITAAPADCPDLPKNTDSWRRK
jgi:hypothetical protein